MVPMRTALLLLLLSAPAVDGQIHAGKHLLPVYVPTASPVPGAHGSEWVTELAVTNRGETAVVLDGLISCGGITTCPVLQISPGATIIDPPVDENGALPGHFFHWSGESTVDVVLRVRDLSRQAQTWGTSVPVVPETEFTSSEIGLLDLPVSPDFRTLVRIYDLETAGGGAVRLKIYQPSDSLDAADVLLRELVVPLTYDAGGSYRQPGYAELPLWQQVPIDRIDRVRVTIEPAASDAPLRFWAFATATNNETQHVTVIAPSTLRVRDLVQPDCSEPAPFAFSSRIRPGEDPALYGVTFRSGVSAPEEAQRLAEKYGFAVRYASTFVPMFSAVLYAEAVADLRCELTVQGISATSYNPPP
jgi:hypothetical protein